MGYYIFRLPRDMPRLTYEELSIYLGQRTVRRIGTTVRVSMRDLAGEQPITITLYGLTIAILHRDGRVEFPAGAGDLHQSTGGWLWRVVLDNRLGVVGCENFVRYLYPNGWDDRASRFPIAGTIVMALSDRRARAT